MPRVQFTRHLYRYFPALAQSDHLCVEGESVAEVIAALERRYPGLGDYLVDDRGALRKHVNIFVGNDLVRDRERLSDSLAPDAEVFIFQALSGG